MVGDKSGVSVERSWVPCMPPPVRNAGNNSATLTFSTGPEDPRVQFRFVIRFVAHAMRP